VSVTGGQLQFVTGNGSTNGNAFYATNNNAQHNIAGSYLIAQSVQLPNLSNGSTYSLMGWWKDQAVGNNLFAWVWSNGQWIARERVAGAFNDVGFTTTDTWFRIRMSADGSTIYWDSSANGYDWTNRRSKAPGFANPTGAGQIVFQAGNTGAAPSPGTAIWDNLNLPNSQVITTRSTGWTVRSRVTATRATAWGVRTTVAATRATAWSVRSRVAATRSTAWAVLGRIISTRSTAWGVRTGVTATRSTAWAVRSMVTAARTTAWRVYERVVTARSTSWAVLGRILAVRGTTWRVATTVQSTVSTSWAVRTSVTTSRDTSWAVAELVTTGKSTQWAVSKQVLVQRGTQWAVRQQVEALRSTQWAVAPPSLTISDLDLAGRLGKGSLNGTVDRPRTGAGLSTGSTGGLGRRRTGARLGAGASGRTERT
jgi:hypothetical protein